MHVCAPLFFSHFSSIFCSPGILPGMSHIPHSVHFYTSTCAPKTIVVCLTLLRNNLPWNHTLMPPVQIRSWRKNTSIAHREGSTFYINDDDTFLIRTYRCRNTSPSLHHLKNMFSHAASGGKVWMWCHKQLTDTCCVNVWCQPAYVVVSALCTVVETKDRDDGLCMGQTCSVVWFTAPSGFQRASGYFSSVGTDVHKQLRLISLAISLSQVWDYRLVWGWWSRWLHPTVCLSLPFCHPSRSPK